MDAGPAARRSFDGFGFGFGFRVNIGNAHVINTGIFSRICANIDTDVGVHSTYNIR